MRSARPIRVESNVYNVPQRLAEIDRTLRVYYNPLSGLFGVHAKDLKGYYLLAEFSELDSRVVDAVKRAYTVAQNTGAPYRHMLQQQIEQDRQAELAQQKRLEDIAYGMKSDAKFVGKSVVPGATVSTDSCCA